MDWSKGLRTAPAKRKQAPVAAAEQGDKENRGGRFGFVAAPVQKKATRAPLEPLGGAAAAAPVAAAPAEPPSALVSAVSAAFEAGGDFAPLLAQRIQAGKYDYKARIAQQKELLDKFRAAARAQGDLRGGVMQACQAHSESLANETARAAAAEGKLSELETRCGGLETSLAAAEAREKDAVATAAQLRDHSTVIESSLELAQADARRAQLDADATHKALAEANEAKAGLAARTESLSAQADAAAQNAARLQAELSQANTTTDLLRQQMSGATAAQQLAEREKDRLQIESARLQEDVDKTRAQISQLEERAEQREADMRETTASFRMAQELHAARVSELQTQNRALEEQLAQAQSESASHAQQAQAAEAQNRSLGEQVVALTQERDALSVEAGALKKDLADLTDESDELRKVCGEQTAELALARPALEQAGRDKAALEEATAALASESAEKTALSTELDAFRAAAGTSDTEQLARLVELNKENMLMSSRLQDVETAATEKSRTAAQLAEQVETLTKDLVEAERIRRELHNTIQNMRGKIRVLCRARPLGDEEGPDGSLKMTSGGTVCEIRSGDGKLNQFSFDKALDGNASQEAVWGEVESFVQSALDGYRVALFAYGATGAGKTWTMMGGEGADRGIIPRAMAKILGRTQSLSTQGWTYELRASFLEIYNEQVRDLLAKNAQDEAVQADKKARERVIRLDANGLPMVAGLTEIVVRTESDVHAVMERASKARSVAATASNARSSRSHCVFALRLIGTNPASPVVLAGSLSLVDLAGSERLSQSKATGDRKKETAAINKSLSALGDVFTAIKAKQSHIPFRNSTLTRLLEPCLKGDGKAMMVCALSPSMASANESLCSLRFSATVGACEVGKPTKQTRPATAPAGGDVKRTKK